MQAEVLSPRTLSQPVTGRRGMYAPWLEIAMLVEVAVPSWQHRDQRWLHWAVPPAESRWVPGAAFFCDLGRRAGRPGEPGAGERSEEAPAGAECLVEAARQVVSTWRPVLYRHADLGLVSELGEAREQFRRRCLALARPAVLSGASGGPDGAALIARLVAGIQAMTLGEDEVRPARVTARLAWYPADLPPQPLAGELMVHGPIRGGR